MQPVLKYIFRLFIILFLIPGSVPVYSQITSSTADFSDTLTYIAFPETDPFFVFHSSSFGTPVTGKLVASSPGDTSVYNYDWSMYNPVSNSFDPPFFSETDVATSSLSNLDHGCYQVQISSTGLDTVFRAWVFHNDPNVEVEKSPEGKVMPYRYTCDFLRLIGNTYPDTIVYYDLTTGAELSLPNGMAFEWTSDDSEYQIFGSRFFLELFIYNEPPYSRPPTKDTRFTLTAVDSFNLMREDDVLYESVHVKAEFSMWYEDRGDPDSEGVWTESDNPEEESPMEVRFKNLSENGIEFEWSLVDSSKTGEESDIITYDVNDSVVFNYYIPGYYYPGMIAYSEAGCVDSFPLVTNPEIHVLPSELDAPNVFTPNGDGVNDFFVVRSKSLKAFRITIYSSSGRKVYEYQHSDGRFEWEGWDGTMHGKGSSFVQPGVYYYVIDALGWDAVPYRGVEPFTGFVYLFREKE